MHDTITVLLGFIFGFVSAIPLLLLFYAVNKPKVKTETKPKEDDYVDVSYVVTKVVKVK